MSKKYRLIESDSVVTARGNTLYRIMALRNIDCYSVRAGDLGGYIEREDNLSHDDNAWVFDKARVYGKAKVYENASVIGEACVFENAKIYGWAAVAGKAQVYGRTQVYDDASIYDQAIVQGHADVFGSAWVHDKARVFGQAKVYGQAKIYDGAHVGGQAKVHGDAELHANASVCGAEEITCEFECINISNLESNITITPGNIEIGRQVVSLDDLLQIDFVDRCKPHGFSDEKILAYSQLISAVRKIQEIEKKERDGRRIIFFRNQ